MFWLILLGVVTCLTIALRRVRHRQQPLDDQLYSKSVAVEHVQSGVAWVRGDGTFGSVNRSFAEALARTSEDLVGRKRYEAFSQGDQSCLHEAYDQALLRGITSTDTDGTRADGSRLRLNVRLVAAHDPQDAFRGGALPDRGSHAGARTRGSGARTGGRSLRGPRATLRG